MKIKAKEVILAKKCLSLIILLYHSYLKASIGLSLEAWKAGATPKIIPTRLETLAANPIDQGVMVVVKNRPMIKEPATPSKIPIVLRLTGTRAEEGKKILEKTDLISEETMALGAQKIVSLID